MQCHVNAFTDKKVLYKLLTETRNRLLNRVKLYHNCLLNLIY